MTIIFRKYHKRYMRIPMINEETEKEENAYINS